MFKSIHAENLFSWETLNYEIKPGISQICGTNADDGGTGEGAGKSAVPNVLCWTLFGSIPKDARIDDVIRHGCKSGSGTVHLEDGSTIHRSRKPNDLYIKSADGTVLKGKDAKETQLMINKLIGLDFDAFCQTVYFAQNYPNKFISAGETDKARILSEVQDLTIFDRARKRVMDEIKKVDGALLDLERQKTAVEAEESKLKSNSTLLMQFVNKFGADKEEKRKTLLDQIEKLEGIRDALVELVEGADPESLQTDHDQIEAILQTLADERVEQATAINMADVAKRERLRLKQDVESYPVKFQKNKIKVDRTNAALAQAGAKATKLVAKIKDTEAEASNPGNCPACGQAASDAMLQRHKDHLEAQARDAATELESIHESIEEYKAELEVAAEEWAALKDAEVEAKNKLQKAKDAPTTESAQARLKEIEAETQELQAALKKIRADQAAIERNRAELNSMGRVLEKAVAELAAAEKLECLKELQKLEQIDSELLTQETRRREIEVLLARTTTHKDNLTILKTGFKEVKQYVFQSMLRELSVKSTALATELFEVPVRVEFSNEDVEDGGVSKIQTVVTLDGVERGLGLLSGGQFSRVALAVNIALSDIISQRGTSAIGLMILDEPFQNLAVSSKEKVIRLLEARGKDTILIEHDEIIKQIVTNVFSVELRDGVSRAV